MNPELSEVLFSVVPHPVPLKTTAKKIISQVADDRRQDVADSARRCIPAFDQIPKSVKIRLQFLRDNSTKNAGFHQGGQNTWQFIGHAELHGRELRLFGVEAHPSFGGQTSHRFPMELLSFNPLSDSGLPMKTETLSCQCPVCEIGIVERFN